MGIYKMTEKEDYLDVDTPIVGQNWVCLSFVSPEKILKNKDVYFFTEFMKTYCDDNKLNYNAVKEKYDDFMYTQQERLEKDFHKENKFQTSVRGVKVRGTYESRQEAEIRSKVLNKLDTSHHIYVAQVGYWLPWEPDPDKIQDQVFSEDQLNELVSKKNENKADMDIFYE